MPEDEARAIMLAHALEPLEPYPGSTRPWKSRHSCGRIVSPTLGNVRGGKGLCRYCNSSFPYDGPALLYLVVDRDAVKIGCANTSGRRLDDHRRHGWKVAWTLDTATGDDAYNLEQSVISWWRDELGLPLAYDAAHMPQWGYTETALWEDMHPAYVLAKVDQLANDLGLGQLRLHPTRYLEERPHSLANPVGPRARVRQCPANQEPLDLR